MLTIVFDYIDCRKIGYQPPLKSICFHMALGKTMQMYLDGYTVQQLCRFIPGVALTLVLVMVTIGYVFLSSGQFPFTVVTITIVIIILYIN